MKNVVAEILDRDLKKLSDELMGYADETLIWKITDGIANSAGNLTLHICGNLRHFIGATLGKDGYVRNREAEFSDKNVSRNKLLAEIEVTRTAVKKALAAMTDDALKDNYPLNVLGEVKSNEFFLTHLVAHFNYHLGQVNYHRRLVK
jgi:uncharacterized damage-inducible protein DinB